MTYTPNDINDIFSIDGNPVVRTEPSPTVRQIRMLYYCFYVMCLKGSATFNLRRAFGFLINITNRSLNNFLDVTIWDLLTKRTIMFLE